MAFPTPAAGRFEFIRTVSNGTGGLVWIALDLESRQHVVLRLVSPEHAQRLERLAGFKHRHLAGILDVIPSIEPSALPDPIPPDAGSVLAVAEFVPGISLQEQIEAGRVLPAKAVAWVMRLIDLLGAIHTRDAVLGHLSPYAVLAKSAGRAIAPVVSELLYPPLAPFCSLARILGGEPSAEDDVWALCCTLYAAITGELPYAGTTPAELKTALSRGNVKSLLAHGVDEPNLDVILKQALTREDRGRLCKLDDLARVLDDWERDATAPPRLPLGTPPVARRRAHASPGAATDVLFDLTGLSSRVSFLPGEGGPLRGMSTPPPPPAAPAAGLGPRATRPVAPAQRPSGRVAATPVPGSQPHTAFTPLPIDPHPPWAGSSPSRARQSGTPAPPSYASRPSAAPRPSAPLSSSPVTAPSSAQPRSNPAAAPPVGGSAIRGFARGSTAPPAPRPNERSLLEEAQLRWPWLAATAALVGIIVVLVWDRGKQPEPETSSATPSASGSGKPNVPSAPRTVEDATDARDACITAHFKRTKGAPPNVGFVCGDGDFRGITLRLHRLLSSYARVREAVDADAGADAASSEPAGSLGWYELAATAVVRHSCCKDAAPATLPKSTGSCEQLGDVVSSIAQSLGSDEDMNAAANRFDLATNCLLARRAAGGYGYSTPPTAQNRRAFQAFVQRARTNRAKRR